MFQLPVGRSSNPTSTDHCLGAKKHDVNLNGFGHSAHKKNVELVPVTTEANRNFASMAIGPSALVGGTAIFCTAALRSESMSPLSIIYMILLAIQYSLQPRVSKKFLDKRINKRSVTMVEEITKISLATAILSSYGKEKFLAVSRGWSLKSALIAAGIPAMIYAVQGVLYIFSYQNLDSVTFNGLSQTKTLSAALCCYLIMGQKQSAVQMVALFLLASSALIFQGILGKVIRKWTESSPSKIKTEKPPSTSRFTLGIIPCLAASFLSGLAGAFSQKGLQTSGGNGRDAYLYTIEVSGFSAICLVLSMVFERRETTTSKEKQMKDTKGNNASSIGRFFDYWNVSTMYPILLKALGGVLTALVHKHSGSVAKGYALICGLVLSGVIQTIIDNESLSKDQMAAIVLVNLSSWLHFTNPDIL